jgi:hypothetical protein
VTRYTPQWIQAGTYAASQDRRLVAALWPAAASSGCAVTVNAGMVLNVAAGQVAVPTANNSGSVLCTSDAVEQVTIAAAPAAPNNRIDLVVCQVRSNDIDGGSNNDFLFQAVAGTAAASPVVPAVPANAVAVAQIYVPGNAASIVAGNITDVRPGGLPVPPVSGAGSFPRGYVGGIYGPSSAFNAASGTILALTLAVTAGRRYRVNAYCLGTQQTTNGNTFVQMTDTGGYFNSNLWRLWSVTGLQPNTNGAGGSSRTFLATASGNVTFTMAASASAGTLQVGVNWAWITVEDIGT